jgi:hypothetical protein
MAAEPITLFSHSIDPPGVARALRGLAPKLDMQGTDENWTRIIIRERRGLLRRAATIEFNHDRDYYSGPGWQQQRTGMLGYFSQFRLGALMPKVIRTIDSFRFVIGIIAQPDLDIEGNDPRLKYVFAAAKLLDATIFTPSSLRDAQGRVLVAADGATDERAVWPAAPVVERAAATAASDADDDEDDDEEDDEEDEEDEPKMEPPTPQRIARRALALAAVAGRALLEQEDRSDPGVEETRQRINQWVDTVGIRDELEPDEEKLLRQGLGKPAQQAAIDGCWRLEGLGVLAWALGKFDVPRHDQTVEPPALLKAIHILDAPAAKGMIADPHVRSIDELKAMAERILAVHWRLRQFRLDGKAIEDWASKAKNAWFPLNVAGLPMVNGDLALGDVAIIDAPEELFDLASSIAQERHQAINWLAGESEVYSETDTST